MIDRRALILSAAAIGATALAGPAFAVTPIGPEDMVLGSSTAPVTVFEYASASCPHCARWSMEVFPEFYRRFVQTGQARYVVREILTDPAELAAAGFLLARCAGRARYYDALQAVFAAQTEVYQSRDIEGPLSRVAQTFGINDAQFRACITDQGALQALNARVTRNGGTDGVHSTPTFIIGSRRLVGEQSLDVIAAAIAQATGGSAAGGSADDK
jgi:protein-disulfide isomerase